MFNTYVKHIMMLSTYVLNIGMLNIFLSFFDASFAADGRRDVDISVRCCVGRTQNIAMFNTYVLSIIMFSTYVLNTAMLNTLVLTIVMLNTQMLNTGGGPPMYSTQMCST